MVSHKLRRWPRIHAVGQMGRQYDRQILANFIVTEAKRIHIARRDIIDGLAIVRVTEQNNGLDLRCDGG